MERRVKTGVKAHSERCCNDRDESSQVQEKRMQEQGRREDGREAWKGKKMEITVDTVLRAREEMMKNKAKGMSDCLVTEMLQRKGRCTGNDDNPAQEG